MHYSLGYSLTGNLETNLFPGAVYDSHQMKIYAQIYDEHGAFEIYDFPESVLVISDKMTNLNTIEELLISEDPTFSTNIILNEGSNKYFDSIQEIQKISSLLNEQSLSDELNIMKLNNNTGLSFPQIYGPLSNYEGVLPVST